MKKPKRKAKPAAQAPTKKAARSMRAHMAARRMARPTPAY